MRYVLRLYMGDGRLQLETENGGKTGMGGRWGFGPNTNLINSYIHPQTQQLGFHRAVLGPRVSSSLRSSLAETFRSAKVADGTEKGENWGPESWRGKSNHEINQIRMQCEDRERWVGWAGWGER